MNNTQILTAGSRIYAKKRKQREQQVEEIRFDEAARKEYLTGFQKRKQERRALYKKKMEERARQERLEVRRLRREAREEMAQQRLREYEAYTQSLRQDTSSSEEEEEEEEEEEVASDDEATPTTTTTDPWDLTSPKVSSFTGQDTTTTVTIITDIDEEAELHAAAQKSLKAREEAAQARKQALKDQLIQQEMKKLEKALARKNMPKKFRYQSKAAHRHDMKKAKAAKSKHRRHKK